MTILASGGETSMLSVKCDVGFFFMKGKARRGTTVAWGGQHEVDRREGEGGRKGRAGGGGRARRKEQDHALPIPQPVP